MTFTVLKDPLADLDFTIDWSAWLGADTIASSTWALAAGWGVTMHDPTIDTSQKKTTVWLASGSVAEGACVYTNYITTRGGRADERSIVVTPFER